MPVHTMIIIYFKQIFTLYIVEITLRVGWSTIIFLFYLVFFEEEKINFH